MTWIVGLIGREGDAGALAFARWLSRALPGGAGSVVPVRVLDAEHLRAVLRFRHLADEVERERAALARAGVVAGPFAAPEVIAAMTAVDGLEDARRRHAAAGIVVARAATRRRRPLLRLGPVARGLLQTLPCPVIVVPPDLTEPGIGAGPVVAVSTLSPGSVQACRLARELSDGAERDLAILHVAGARAGDRPRDPAGPEAGSALAHPERAFARWVARHGVWPELTAVVRRELAVASLAYAEARRSPLLAIAARSASPSDRPVLPWRWLAAHAAQPVLVVPPGPAVDSLVAGEELAPEGRRA